MQSGFAALLLEYGGGGGGGGGGAGRCDPSPATLDLADSRLLREYGGGGGVCRPSSLYRSIWSRVSKSAWEATSETSKLQIQEL